MGKNNKDKAPISKGEIETAESKPELEQDQETVIVPDNDDEPADSGKELEQDQETVTLDDRKEYTVIVVNLSPLKAGTEKTVSGNVAKALIKKGFVKLKN